MHRLFATLDATRAELAEIKRLLDQHDAHPEGRGPTVSRIAILLAYDEQLDADNERLMAERDAARAALERVERRAEHEVVTASSIRIDLKETRAQLANADQAGRALVVALEALLAHLEYREPDGWMSGQVHADDADAARAALTAAPTRWRTGEEPE